MLVPDLRGRDSQLIAPASLEPFVGNSAAVCSASFSFIRIWCVSIVLTLCVRLCYGLA